jgi:hypothetical protein
MTFLLKIRQRVFVMALGFLDGLFMGLLLAQTLQTWSTDGLWWLGATLLVPLARIRAGVLVDPNGKEV